MTVLKGRKVVSFCVPILLIASVRLGALGATNLLTIGVIAHGNPATKNTSVERFTYSINIIWTFINTDEVFHILRSVRSFDAREDIDIIMLLDYNPVILRMPELLETKYKDIIVWGDNSKEILTITDDKTAFGRTNEEICGGEVDPTLYYGDPYCKTDLKSPGDTGYPYESMTVTAPKALVQLVEQLKWKSVFVIHENATAREARVLMDTLSAKQIFLVIYNIDTTPDLHATLQLIYDQTVPFDPELNFVLLCRFHCARKVFRTANQFDTLNTKKKTLLKKVSRWLVTVYGHSRGVSRALQACADDLDNVVIIAIPEFNGAGSSHLEVIVVEMLRDWYVYKEQALNGTDIPNVRQYMMNLLKQKSLNPASKCKGYNIDTLLWFKSGRGFSSVGYVDVTGSIVLKADLFPNTKFGYNKRMFRVSTLPYGPFVIKTVYENGTVKYEGSVMDLLEELSRDLNFTYNITEPVDQKWGTIEDEANHIFNGMIGELQREEIDFAAAPLSQDSNRDKAVDFSFPFYYEYTTVITKKPDPQTTKWRTFVDLFKWQVLVAIGVTLGLVTVLLYVLEKNNPFYDIPENGEERSRNGGLHYLHNSFWYIYGALLSQGGVHLPDSFAGRTLVSGWWLMSIVVVGIYSGNLIAFLTVAKEKPPFNTLAEMVQMNDYKWGTLGGTIWEETFLNSPIPDYKAVGDGLRRFNRTDPRVLHMNVSNHLSRVHKGNYAWLGDKTTIEIAIAQECDLIQIKEEFLPMKYAFSFQDKSPHTLIFSQQIMKINEGGLLQIWKRKWWPKNNFCVDNQMVSKPISLMDVQSAFYVCVIGAFVGFVAFLTEVIVFKYRTRHKNKENKENTDPVNVETESTTEQQCET